MCLYESEYMYLDNLVLRVRYWDAGIASNSYVTFHSITRLLSMRFISGNATLGPSTWQ